MIERHVTFEVLPEKVEQFVAFFADHYRPAMMKSPGFLSVELIVEIDQPACYQMVIRFDSLEQSEAWRSSEAHKALSPILKTFYTSSAVLVYQFVA
jgi:antibiotic biosynthesis monooxygenase (ABM) superfamily enzyme